MKKVLILPFHIQSDFPEADYLAEGLLEELIEAVSGTPGLRATGRSISLYLKDHPLPGGELKAQFGIDFTVEGSVRKSGDQKVIAARLIDTAGDEVVTSFKFDFDEQSWTDGLQEMVRVLFRRDEKSTDLSIVDPQPANKARQYYLKGLYHWNRYTHEEMHKAIEFYQLAIREDDQYAPAYAGMASAYSVIAVMGYELPQPAFVQAKRYVSKALSLNDKHSDSYVCAAFIDMFYDRDFPQVRVNLDHALKLNPHNIQVHHLLSFYYAFMQDFSKSEKHSLVALKEDPLGIPFYAMLARLGIYRRDFNKALEYLEAGLTVDAEAVPLWELRAQAYLLMGNLETAIAGYRSCIDSLHYNPLNRGMLALAYAHAGFLSESRNMEESLELDESARRIGNYDYAKAVARLGHKDYDGFFRHINLALDKEFTLHFGDILNNPLYAEIRKDDRYRDFLIRCRLDPDQYVGSNSRKPASMITITTNTRETLQLDPQDIAFVKSDGNYSTVHWHQDDVLHKAVLRLPMSKLEDQLQPYEYLVRCHKSYLVNMDDQLQLTGNARGYFLESTFLPIRIPVSRSKNSQMKSLFQGD